MKPLVAGVWNSGKQIRALYCPELKPNFVVNGETISQRGFILDQNIGSLVKSDGGPYKLLGRDVTVLAISESGSTQNEIVIASDGHLPDVGEIAVEINGVPDILTFVQGPHLSKNGNVTGLTSFDHYESRSYGSFESFGQTVEYQKDRLGSYSSNSDEARNAIGGAAIAGTCVEVRFQTDLPTPSVITPGSSAGGPTSTVTYYGLNKSAVYPTDVGTIGNSSLTFPEGNPSSGSRDLVQLLTYGRSSQASDAPFGAIAYVNAESALTTNDPNDPGNGINLYTGEHPPFYFPSSELVLKSGDLIVRFERDIDNTFGGVCYQPRSATRGYTALREKLRGNTPFDALFLAPKARGKFSKVNGTYLLDTLGTEAPFGSSYLWPDTIYSRDTSSVGKQVLRRLKVELTPEGNTVVLMDVSSNAPSLSKLEIRIDDSNSFIFDPPFGKLINTIFYSNGIRGQGDFAVMMEKNGRAMYDAFQDVEQSLLSFSAKTIAKEYLDVADNAPTNNGAIVDSNFIELVPFRKTPTEYGMEYTINGGADNYGLSQGTSTITGTNQLDLDLSFQISARTFKFIFSNGGNTAELDASFNTLQAVGDGAITLIMSHPDISQNVEIPISASQNKFIATGQTATDLKTMLDTCVNSAFNHSIVVSFV